MTLDPKFVCLLNVNVKRELSNTTRKTGLKPIFIEKASDILARSGEVITI